MRPFQELLGPLGLLELEAHEEDELLELWFDALDALAEDAIDGAALREGALGLRMLRGFSLSWGMLKFLQSPSLGADPGVVDLVEGHLVDFLLRNI